MLRNLANLKSSYGFRHNNKSLSLTTYTRRLLSFTKMPAKQGFYDSSLEKDSCGVGIVAHLKRSASRQIVIDANQMLVRMSHRGGCGCEVNTGDGAGKQPYMYSYDIYTPLLLSPPFIFDSSHISIPIHILTIY